MYSIDQLSLQIIVLNRARLTGQRMPFVLIVFAFESPLNLSVDGANKEILDPSRRNLLEEMSTAV